MKILLVAAREELMNVLSFHLAPLGFTLVQADDPVRLINNFDRLDADGILFNVADFPRHWKPLLSLVRTQKSKEQTVFILIAPQDMEFEEAAKAAHLGANGILREDLSDKKEIYRLEEIVRRYRTVKEKRAFTRFAPVDENELGFMFTHPRRLALVTGKVHDISVRGAGFIPSRASMVEDLAVGDQIPRCSLKVSEEILSVTCKLSRNRAELGLEFVSLDDECRKVLLSYITSRSERALKSAVTAGG